MIQKLGWAVVVWALLSVGASAEWTTSIQEDRMTGAKSCYAMSPSIAPETRMNFPYHDTLAWLGVGYNGSRHWVFFGFSNQPNLRNGTIGNGYSTYTTRIKWDDVVESVRLIQEWGSRFLQITPRPDEAVSRIASSSTVLLELDWYGTGLVYFEFPLEGAADAIDAMHQACET